MVPTSYGVTTKERVDIMLSHGDGMLGSVDHGPQPEDTTMHRTDPAAAHRHPEAGWQDAVPWLYRSEAFFEDLEEPPAPTAQSARAAQGGGVGVVNEVCKDLVRAAGAVFGGPRLGGQGA
jgi:hypothetical protein